MKVNETYLIEKAKDNEIRTHRIQANIEQYSGNFDAAFNFDITQFVEDLVATQEPPGIIVVPEAHRQYLFGAAIAQVVDDSIYVASSMEMKVEMPLIRKDYNIEDMYLNMSRAWDGGKIPAFPRTEYDLQSGNRPRQRQHTDAVLSRVLGRSNPPSAPRIAVDPDPATLAFCVSKSLTVYSTRHIENTLPVAQAPHPAVHFLGYTTYDALVRYGRSACGFVFNPYRKTSQRALLSVTRMANGVECVYVHRYRTYKVFVPFEKPRGLHTFMLDVWPGLFGMKHQQIHPKWYLYDFVTTEAISYTPRLMTIMDTEFIDPLLYKEVKTQVPMPRASHQSAARPASKFLSPIGETEAKLIGTYFIESRAHNKLFTVKKERCTLVQVDVWTEKQNQSRIEIGYLDHMGSYVRQELALKGFLPKDPRFYYRDNRYYFKRPGGDFVTTIDVPVFKHYSNVFGAIVDEIYLFDVVHASRSLVAASVLPALRDYIMDIEEQLGDDPLENFIPVTDESDWQMTDNE